MALSFPSFWRQAAPSPAQPESPAPQFSGGGLPVSRSAKLRHYTYVSAAVGVVCIIFYCTGIQGGSFLSRTGSSVTLSFGAMMLGLILGFLFGIPRTLQHDINPQASAPDADKGEIAYQINTNLEQISDWLTKIIIGVGLVQLGSIGSWLMSFSKEIGAGFNDPVLGQAFVLGMLVYFSGSGFLLGYLWTRLTFGLAIKEADEGLVERRIEQFEAELRADQNALALVARQLSPTPGGSGVSVDELKSAIAKASRHVKVRIFYDAQAARRDMDRQDRAVPIFRALVASDTGERFHRNHAELAYALKDSPRPDWEAAETELTKAIEIRDRLGEEGFGEYEFNRALCRVRLNRRKDDIIADLKKAAADEWTRGWSFKDAAVIAWFNQNGMKPEDLGFRPTGGVAAREADNT